MINKKIIIKYVDKKNITNKMKDERFVLFLLLLFSEHKILLMITLNNKCKTREVKFNESKGQVIYWPRHLKVE